MRIEAGAAQFGQFIGPYAAGAIRENGNSASSSAHCSAEGQVTHWSMFDAARDLEGRAARQGRWGRKATAMTARCNQRFLEHRDRKCLMRA